MSDNPDDDSLADAFWTVARRLRRGTRETLAPFDLSPSQTRALGVLMRHGSMRLSTLAEHLHIAARSTTEVVDALEERGLVRRDADPSDRRATLVDTTPQGWSVMQQVRVARMNEADRIFEKLNDSDRRDLARLLRKLSPDEER
ncbi:MAG: MarR family transcriptional regulator [Jatrophihabitans sp.]